MIDPLAIVRRFYGEIWNAGELSAIPEICDPELSFRGSLGATKRGHAGFAEYVRQVRGSLGEYRCTIEAAVVEGDRVFAKMRFTGIHQAEFMGYAATRREVSWAGVALFTIRADRIVDLWVLGDVHGLLAVLAANAERPS